MSGSGRGSSLQHSLDIGVSIFGRTILKLLQVIRPNLISHRASSSAAWSEAEQNWVPNQWSCGDIGQPLASLHEQSTQRLRVVARSHTNCNSVICRFTDFIQKGTSTSWISVRFHVRLIHLHSGLHWLTSCYSFKMKGFFTFWNAFFSTDINTSTTPGKQT